MTADDNENTFKTNQFRPLLDAIISGWDNDNITKKSNFQRAVTTFAALYNLGNVIITSGPVSELLDMPKSSTVDVLDQLHRYGVLVEFTDVDPLISKWDSVEDTSGKKINSRNKFYAFNYNGNKKRLQNLPQFSSLKKRIEKDSTDRVVDRTPVTSTAGENKITLTDKQLQSVIKNALEQARQLTKN